MDKKIVEQFFNTNDLIQEEKVFTKVDFTHVSLAEYSFFNCVFEQCVFIDSVWDNAKFYSCIFNVYNLSFVNVKDSLLQDVTFNECKLVGIEFYKVNKTFFSVAIVQSSLLNCNFSDLFMKGTSFKGSRLKECCFKNTQLEGTDFSETDLQETIFRKCNLNKANFKRAKNYSLDITHNKVKNAVFTYPDVMYLLKYFNIIIDYTQ